MPPEGELGRPVVTAHTLRLDITGKGWEVAEQILTC